MKVSKALVFLVTVGMLSGALIVAAQNVKVQDAPAAVQKTVTEQTKNATLVALKKEVEDGKTVYELETKRTGKARDLMIDGSGKVISVEEEVDIAAIPAAARTAIEKKAAGGKIVRVEILTTGKGVSYEAQLSRNGKASEVTVKADGSPAK